MTIKFINNPKYHRMNQELKSTYNKWMQRQFGKKLPVHVFGSGSEGNSVYLKPYKTLIDLGMTYKVYNKYDPTFFIDVDYIIITHHHGDHLNPSTLFRVLESNPHIKIITSEFMWKYITSEYFKPEYIKRKKGEEIPFGHDLTFKTNDTGQRIKKPSKWTDKFLKHKSKFMFEYAQTLKTHTGIEFLLEPLTVKHGDIVNLAIQISDPSVDLHFLYASDLDNLDGERTFIDCFGETQRVSGLNQNRQYNCMFLETNYDEEILQNWYDNLDPSSEDYRGKKARADGNLRHISEQEADIYIKKHLVENGIFVPLHASKTFGTLHQS